MQWPPQVHAPPAPPAAPSGLPLEPQPPPPPRPLPSDFRNAAGFLIPLGVGFSFMGLIAVALFVLLFDPSDPKSWLILLSAAGGPVCLYAGLRIRRTKRAVYQHGQVALGKVVRIEQRVGSNDASPRTAKAAYVHFAVGDAGHEAAFDAGWAPPPIDLPVWVLYDPSNPRRNYVVGKLSY